jgi:hypothetical protein
MFYADQIPHEVLPSFRERHSFTVWQGWVPLPGGVRLVQRGAEAAQCGLSGRGGSHTSRHTQPG